jgi:hypothetical protein
MTMLNCYKLSPLFIYTFLVHTYVFVVTDFNGIIKCDPFSVAVYVIIDNILIFLHHSGVEVTKKPRSKKLTLLRLINTMTKIVLR